MAQRAIVVTKRCPMADDQCASTVIRHIGDKYPQPFDAAALVEQRCGRYVRGTHAGKLRGWASIEVCTVGGWRRDGYETGRVMRPGEIGRIEITDFNGKKYLDVA